MVTTFVGSSTWILRKDKMGVRAWVKHVWLTHRIKAGKPISPADAVWFASQFYNNTAFARYLYHRGNRGVKLAATTCLLAQFFAEVTGIKVHVGVGDVTFYRKRRTREVFKLDPQTEQLRSWFDQGLLPELECR